MSDKSHGYGPPKLDGYSVEPETPKATALRAEATAEVEHKFRVTLHGSGFIARAMPLVVMIGDLWIQRLKIAPDGRSVTCFLDEMPEEGAVISVGYGGDERVELAERFSRNRVSEGDIE